MVNPPPEQLITPITEKRRVQILDEFYVGRMKGRSGYSVTAGALPIS